ncbi:hypothetical protein FACS1894141_0390 [Spirochaetia bacterium]|nr:hypothetical protein FACS1894141_0390 [Spirochaetia bacterium]
MNTIQESEIMTRRQAASYLQFCVTTLDRIKDLPRLKIRRGVRFRKADLDKWLDRQTVQAQGAQA